MLISPPLYCVPGIPSPEFHERAGQEARDEPEREIVRQIDLYADKLFPPGKDFGPYQVGEDEAVTEERERLESQYQGWKSNQGQP